MNQSVESIMEADITYFPNECFPYKFLLLIIMMDVEED
jgi:hypothetical protein